MDALKNPTFDIYNFPPLWYNYMLTPIAHLYDLLSKFFQVEAIPMASLPPSLNFYPSLDVNYVPGMLFNTVVKIPFLISDILMALLLHHVVKELTGNKGIAEKAAFLWFLNPFVIWISAGWGMWDTMPALFSLGSFYLLLKKRIVLSAVCLSLGVASKLYPALFIVPIVLYILKSNSFDKKLRNCLEFFSAFSASSVILFIPYLVVAATFFSNYFLANPNPSSSDLFVNPLGFGLTYWSLYLLNRLFTLPVNSELITFASVGSIIFVASSLVLAYWKASKLTFTKQAFDLALAMVLPILVLFLSYRIIPEQWFVWALPFLIILIAGGHVKEIFYWGASFVALLYAVLNCPLPFFFLPLAPWHTNTLLGIVYAFWEIEIQRIVLLAILGVVFSVLMLAILFRLTGFPPPMRHKLNSKIRRDNVC
jgi:hypothetical protein